MHIRSWITQDRGVLARDLGPIVCLASLVIFSGCSHSPRAGDDGGSASRTSKSAPPHSDGDVLFVRDLGGSCEQALVGPGIAPNDPGLEFVGRSVRGEPIYPPDAREQAVQAKVTYCLDIDTDGTVHDLRLIDSSIQHRPPRLIELESLNGRAFEESGARAISQWVYGRPVVGSVPVQVKNFRVRLSFEIE